MRHHTCIMQTSNILHLQSDVWHYKSNINQSSDIRHHKYIRHQMSYIWTFDINHILDIWHLKSQIIQILCRYQTSYIRRHRSNIYQTSHIRHHIHVTHQTSDIRYVFWWHQTTDIRYTLDIRCLTKNIRHQTSYMRRWLQILDIRHQTSDIWRLMSDVRHLMCDKCIISDVRRLRSDISMMSDIRRLTLDIRRYTSDVWLLTWDTWHQTYHNICHQTCVLVACLTSNVW